MSRVKNYLTTGEAAAIFDVDPDTVLRWIKSGEIPAIRTPGGNYRINRNVFLTRMFKDTSNKEKNEIRSELSYCWEYNSESGVMPKACEECVVYKSRARRCYELSNLSATIGNTSFFCSKSCRDYQYFTSILQFAN